MSFIENFTFYGESGTAYQFEVYTLDTSFNDVAGNYLFSARRVDNDSIIHTLLYTGKTESFRDRLNNRHHSWENAIDNGFNCICVKQENNSTNRTYIESELLGKYRLELNRNRISH